ncbi:MAG: hypothetical protein RL152_1542, partial [Bacteroidota bacterium]
MGVVLKRVSENDELVGIAQLQALNLKKNIDSETALSQG